ncbi:hypothetical protein OIU78_029323 [Salix suchowensis]|nr:hypothetical protein OIU78_029323 [Salix suchowensis]
MGYLQSHPLPYSAISIVTQIPQTPISHIIKNSHFSAISKIEMRREYPVFFVVSCGGWRDAEQTKGTLGRERLRARVCRGDPRGRREEARDERVMCLVWGRGRWVVESRGEGTEREGFFGTDEGRERHTRRRVEEMSRGSGAERKETRDRDWEREAR